MDARSLLFSIAHNALTNAFRRNCSRLRGRVGLQSKFRASLPLCKKPNGPQIPTSLVC